MSHQQPYHLAPEHVQVLAAALAMPQERRFEFLLTQLGDKHTSKRELIGVLSEFLGLAKSVQENARGSLECVLMVEGGLTERAAMQWNIPSLEGALEGSLRTMLPRPGMCGSCAFRAGTVASQCLPTVQDAVVAVDAAGNFMCHEIEDADGEFTHICAGFAAWRGKEVSR